MTSPSVIRLHPEDNVVIARATLLPGVSLGENVATVDRVPAGHKVAVRAIAPAEAVRRYGQIIGFASAPIVPGQHVHVHNLEMGDFAKDWPPNSPDLSPIENVWSYVQSKVNAKGCKTFEQFRQTVLDEVKGVPKQMLVHLFSSMPKRMAKVVEMVGDKTGY